MKYSKLMQERIRRVKVLFRELGYRVFDTERMEETYSAGFENEEGLQGGFFIDRDSRFLEIAFTFSFPHAMGSFLRERLEEMLKICYEYGCYIKIEMTKSDLSFSVFTKEYFSGLSYYSLRDSLRDFNECVRALAELWEIRGKESSER